MLANSFKLIDFSQQQQVFNGPLDTPRMTLDIKRRKQLGSGAQGDVFEVKVKGLRGEFVDKTRQIYKNPKLAKEILRSRLECLNSFGLSPTRAHNLMPEKAQSSKY